MTILDLNKIFTAPFPYTRGFISEMISTLKVCIVATIIIFFLKPFGLEEASLTIILGFGFAVFLSALINILFSTYLFVHTIDEEKWCVWKEIIRTLIYLCINIVAIILFVDYNFDLVLNGLVILKFFGVTIFIAIIPISIRVVRINNWLLKNKLKEAQELSNILKEIKPTSVSTIIELKSNIVNDIVKTTNIDLQFIEAEKNYITVTELVADKPKNSLLRLSLVKALEQIEDENIIRCHRSYAVNIRAVEKVSGNSQGLKLFLNDTLKQIPVSKSYKDVVSKKLASLE